jgi:hypothetical protein
MRAEVIMPRSPTSTTRSSPNRSVPWVTVAANAVGAAVLAADPFTAPGRAGGGGGRAAGVGGVAGGAGRA